VPTNYTDQFYTFDPAFPPPVGTSVTFVIYTLTDQNDDGDIDALGGPGIRDRVNGSRVQQSYPGDTVTINVPGVGNVTYTGVTFYLENGQRVFTPTDGQVLQNGTFVSSTFVTTQGSIQVPSQLGPPCFTPGTLILTPQGERPVETLAVGDMVITRDRGARSIVWTGVRSVSGTGPFAPVRIRAGAFGNRRDLVVSPQHRMVVRGWRAELHAGQLEVLVAAVHLVNGGSVVRAPRAEVTYVHFMLDRHEIVFAEGAETESLDPAGDLAGAEREIARLFPALSMSRAAGPVRPAVRAFEAQAMAY
jgi:hypothetical protein